MRRIVSFMGFLLLSCSSSLPTPGAAPQGKIDMTGCHFSVPEPYYSGYADFIILISFYVNSAGAPQDVKIHKNLPRISETEILRCVKNWRFALGSVSDGLLASFHWDHNYGWKLLRIGGRNSKAFLELQLGGRNDR